MSNKEDFCVNFNDFNDITDQNTDIQNNDNKIFNNQESNNQEGYFSSYFDNIPNNQTQEKYVPNNYNMKIDLDNLDSLCVDFDDFDDSDNSDNCNESYNVLQNCENLSILQNDENSNIELDTKKKYLGLRKSKCDPIGMYQVDCKNAFIYPYKWDPYTGKILDLDSDGPLYFDPDLLIKTFYTNRLNNLWVNPSEDLNGYYEGYYDDGLGIGESFTIPGRGTFNEWYLFRLPIVDCYLSENHNLQMITMGPKLSSKEIEKIDKLANIKPNNYKSIFGQYRPSLMEIKKLYDIAISDKTEDITINKKAVKQLINMKG